MAVSLWEVFEGLRGYFRASLALSDPWGFPGRGHITYVRRRGAIGSKPIFLYKCVALLGLLWGCCGPLGALKDPLGAQEGSPGPLGGAQCPAGGRSILDRSLIDPKVAESVFAGDVEQNVVG